MQFRLENMVWYGRVGDRMCFSKNFELGPRTQRQSEIERNVYGPNRNGVADGTTNSEVGTMPFALDIIYNF